MRRSASFPSSVLILCFGLLARSEAEMPSVTGVQLGSLEAQVEAKLGQSFKWVTMLKWDGSNMNVRFGATPNGDESYVLQSVNGKIYFISHYVRFKPGAAPELASLASQLREKYGTPLENAGETQQLTGFHHWLFDSDGTNLHTRPSIPCPISSGGRSGDSTPNVPRMTHTMSQPANPKCPVFLETFVGSRDDNRQIAGYMTVDLGDSLPMLLEYQRLDKIKQAEHDRQVNGAKGVKPPL